MAKVVVLGGSGAVGSVAVKTLAGQDMFTSVVIADRNGTKARDIIAELGTDSLSFVELDADDAGSIRKAIAGCDVVLNCVGPFYKTVRMIIEAVIEEGINYVDICDDVDVTLEILGLDAQAKDAGITALIGHRFHCMSIEIPMFLDGSLTHVKYFEPDGIALRQTFDFPVVGKGIPIYPYPHPEQVTLPKYLRVRQVTNKGSVLPNEYYNLTRDLCGLGLAGREALDVKGTSVIPYDFAVAYILKERERILKETGFDSPCGCCSVIAKGRKDGKYREYRFHMASRSQALGEGTGIPAAMGVILMQQGKVKDKGVLPPEACVDPMDFVGLISRVMTLDEKKEGGDSFGGVIVESVDAAGEVTRLEI